MSAGIAGLRTLRRWDLGHHVRLGQQGVVTGEGCACVSDRGLFFVSVDGVRHLRDLEDWSRWEVSGASGERFAAVGPGVALLMRGGHDEVEVRLPEPGAPWAGSGSVCISPDGERVFGVWAGATETQLGYLTWDGQYKSMLTIPRTGGSPQWFRSTSHGRVLALVFFPDGLSDSSRLYEFTGSEVAEPYPECRDAQTFGCTGDGEVVVLVRESVGLTWREGRGVPNEFKSGRHIFGRTREAFYACAWSPVVLPNKIMLLPTNLGRTFLVQVSGELDALAEVVVSGGLIQARKLERAARDPDLSTKPRSAVSFGEQRILVASDGGEIYLAELVWEGL